MDLTEKGLGKKLGLSLVISSALLVTACGGSSSRTTTNSDGTNPTPTPSPTATPTPTPDPTSTPDPDPTPTGDGKVSGPLDPIQDDVVTGVLVDEVASQLPTEISGAVACVASSINYLVDGPDAVLAAATSLAEGADPFAAFNSAQADIQASLTRFAGQLQSTLTQLADRGTCDPTTAPTASSTNPLAATPLAAVGEQILALTTALGESEDDPNLSSVTATLTPVLDDLALAMGAVPAELQSAPVLGAALGTLADAVTDVSSLLTSVGLYDSAGTAADASTLIDNLLSNVLLGVLPLGEVDAATGQTFSADVAAGIASLSGALGTGVEEVVTPLFNQGLDGALSPLLDPVEGALALILHPAELNTDSGIWEAVSPLVDPLEGALSGIAGNGAGSPADALMALIVSAQGGLSLEEAAAGFIMLGDGNTLDNLSAFGDPLNGLAIDGQLGEILGLIDGIFGLDLIDALDSVTGDLIDTLLGGLI